jgi:crotonobetainyl-CoA:carnitine CoA-transferase CaiB-like acyl-CoA transferase
MAENGLLSGIRILDFSIWRPGPYTTQLLAELGADICKVEPPGGDPMHAYPSLYEELNSQKRCIELDLKSEDGVRHALALAVDVDVVVEGYRPGVAARLGIGYDAVRAVNPTVVYCSISGLGQVGPLALASGHDINYQAWAGALAPGGGEPVMAAVPIADLAGGLAAAFAVCAAVVRKLRTGEGERIDVAMSDVLATWTGAVTPTAAGVDSSAQGGVPGYGIFATADGGHVTLGIISEDHFWRALCDALGLDDVRDLGFLERMPQQAALQDRIAAAIRQRGRDALVDELLAAGVPAAPALSRAEMLALAHMRERRAVVDDASGTPATGFPVRFEQHPASR